MDSLAHFESVQYGPSLVYWAGEIDLANRESAEKTLFAAAEGGGLITVDMSNVTFMDSTGLHVLVRVLRAMPSGCIVLHGVNSMVANLFEQTGLTRHPQLHVVPCREDPFPEGGALRDKGASHNLYQQILAMKAKHEELVARTRLDIVQRKRWSEHVSIAATTMREASEKHRLHVEARRAWIEAALDRMAA